jgi:hypothetical protein
MILLSSYLEICIEGQVEIELAQPRKPLFAFRSSEINSFYLTLVVRKLL